MKPEVKLIFSSDIYDLDSFQPLDDSKFGFQIRAIVGPQNSKSEESVDMIVCTPEWLKEKYGENSVITGADFIIVFKYDIQKIKSKIKELLESCEGISWNECGRRMSKYGLWEFENYREGEE